MKGQKGRKRDNDGKREREPARGTNRDGKEEGEVVEEVEIEEWSKV